jgi:cytochrome c-type biogenesis protein CcmF
MVTPLWLIFSLGIVSLFFVSANFYVSLSVLIFAWIVAHSIQLVVKNMRNNARLSGSFIGMIMAHIGIAVFVLGATVTTQLGIEKDIEMTFNDSVTVANYDYKFIGVKSLSGPNYGGNIGEIEVSKDGEKLFILKPEKRFYTSGMPMTEAAIEPSLYQDIYVSLGEALNENSWSLRIYFKPLVRLIWLGGILISFGAILAAFDRRYRMKART